MVDGCRPCADRSSACDAADRGAGPRDGGAVWRDLHLERVLVALYVIDSREPQTISLGAATLVSAQRPIDWNIAAAVGVVTVIPILIFSLFVQRYIVRGLTAGAVK